MMIFQSDYVKFGIIIIPEANMKNARLQIIGIMLLIIGTLSPIAYLNNRIISIIPIWNNLIIEDGLWNWQDISFFAVTLVLVILVSLFFIYKKIYYGLIFTAVLNFFTLVIIFAAILQIKSKYAAYPEITMQWGWGWGLLLLGAILFAIIRKSPFRRIIS